MRQNINKMNMVSRFRGFFPVVIDVETSGLNPQTDSMLEIAAVTLKMDEQGNLALHNRYSYHIEPFVGANVDPEALAITGIDPGYPLRFAISEQQALHNLFAKIKIEMDHVHCQRAVLVGHNAWFDLAFMMAAVKRNQLEFNPFHSFTTFDTATLAAVALGETVLARATRAAKIPFDVNLAHSAIYDAEKTAELFCYITNKFKS